MSKGSTKLFRYGDRPIGQVSCTATVNFEKLSVNICRGARLVSYDHSALCQRCLIKKVTHGRVHIVHKICSAVGPNDLIPSANIRRTASGKDSGNFTVKFTSRLRLSNHRETKSQSH